MRRGAALFGIVLTFHSPLGATAQETPQRVAPGIVSTDEGEAFPALSPDGGTLWFSTHDPDWSQHAVVFSRREGDGWSLPDTASFSGARWSDRAARPSPDGRRLYFASNRPLPGEREHDPRDYDIWVAERDDDAWGPPRPVPAPVSTRAPEYHPSPTASGALYFASFDRPGGRGRSDLYVAREEGDGWWVAPLGPGINTQHSEPDVFVDPAERYMVVASTGRPGAVGGDDLYISVRRDGAWSPLIHLGPPINSEAYEYGPFVSPDGRWLWFTSHREGSADLYRIELTSIPELVTELER